MINKSQLLFKPRNFLNNRTSNDLSVEAIRYLKCNWEKSGVKFIEFTTRCQSFRTFFTFDKMVPVLDTFRKLTSIRNTKGSGLKRVGTGSVSKRYQITLFAQLSENFAQKRKFRIQGFDLRKMIRATSWVRMV